MWIYKSRGCLIYFSFQAEIRLDLLSFGVLRKTCYLAAFILKYENNISE
jgi:hypothetical protein